MNKVKYCPINVYLLKVSNKNTRTRSERCPRVRPRVAPTLYRKLCLFYKVFKNEHPKYLFNLIHVRSLCYMLQELRAIFSLLRQSITFSKILFFHTLLSNGITDSNLRNSKSISVFKERILNFKRPSPVFFLFFDCHNPKRIKLITRL